MAILGVAHLQGGRSAAVIYLFGHPTLYTYGFNQFNEKNKIETIYVAI
jgi:hypothetical protein